MPKEKLTDQQIKEILGRTAAELVANDTVVGLGTGTTAAAFIEALKARFSTIGLKSLQGMSTSQASEELVEGTGMRLTRSETQIVMMDVVIDGADQIDRNGNMLKGLGGALLKEKIVAKNAKKYIIMAAEKKKGEYLSGHVPLEVVRYGSANTVDVLARNFGMVRHTFRKKADAPESGFPDYMMPIEHRFVTDEGHYIIDAHIHDGIFHDCQSVHRTLLQVPGVVETGFFPCNARSPDGFKPHFIFCDEYGRISRWTPMGSNDHYY